MVDKDWFRQAFDSGYVKRYAHRDLDEAEEFIETIITLFGGDIHGRKALDVACGAGRHSRALARRHFRVTGIDLSADLIRLARRQAAGENLAVDFHIQDMRTTWPGENYDLILNAFTSFGYFETDEESQQIVDQAAAKLSSSGFFVLDYFNVSEVERNLVPRSARCVGNITLVEERWILDGRVNKRTLELDARGQVGHSFTESVRLFKADDIRAMIRKSGLTVQREWGTYAGEPFTAGTPRYIAVAQKAASPDG
ncbi:MAG: class I SAM-dependent methyltransferase [Acidobacteria bacterium]|nr:class I SAM-dependent methyltransferase [Acidobacteriota bacterium]